MVLAPREGRRRALPYGSFVAALTLVLLLLLGTARAEEAAKPEPFADIAATMADVEARGVLTLAVSGSPRASPVISALRDGKLFAWKWPRPGAPLFIKTDKGYVDARTGDPVDAPAPVNLRKVIVSDAVRGAIETAEGALDLFSPQPAARRKAAEALYQSADPGALALIDKALAQEPDSATLRVLREAKAASLLKSGTGSDADRITAVHELAARADLQTRNLLASLQGQPPTVAAAVLWVTVTKLS